MKQTQSCSNSIITRGRCQVFYGFRDTRLQRNLSNQYTSTRIDLESVKVSAVNKHKTLQ